MTSVEIQAKCKEYREMKRIAEEAQTVADSIADELKRMMNEAGETKRIEGEYKLSYTDCKRTDIDKKRLEVEAPSVYTAFLKETTYKRFQVA